MPFGSLPSGSLCTCNPTSHEYKYHTPAACYMDTNDRILGRTFAIHFIVDILFGVRAVVQVVFFLIITIIYQSAYLAEISLLGVLYILLPDCSRHPSRQSNPNRMWKGLQTAHAIFIFILVALWLSAMALKIKYQVDSVVGDLGTCVERFNLSLRSMRFIPYCTSWVQLRSLAGQCWVLLTRTSVEKAVR